MNTGFPAVFISISMLFSPCLAAEEEPDRYGPMVAQSQTPLQITGLAPMLQDPFGPEEEHAEVFASLAVASVWAKTGDYQFDYYHNQIMAGFYYAPSETWKLGLYYQYRYVGYNNLDTVTLQFHDAFGIDQNGRNSVDKHRSYIDIPSHDGSPETGFNGDPVVNAINTYLEKTFYRSKHHAFSGGVTLFFNRVNYGIFKNTAFEQAIQLNYGYRHGNHGITLGASISHRPDKTQHLVAVKRWTAAAGISYQYRLAEHHEIIGEYLVSQGKNDTLGDLDEVAFEFVYGYRYLFEDSTIELAAIENVFNHNNSSDIVFSATYRQKLKL